MFNTAALNGDEVNSQISVFGVYSNLQADTDLTNSALLPPFLSYSAPPGPAALVSSTGTISLDNTLTAGTPQFNVNVTYTGPGGAWADDATKTLTVGARVRVWYPYSTYIFSSDDTLNTITGYNDPANCARLKYQRAELKVITKW
jgi:hypothetical protein